MSVLRATTTAKVLGTHNSWRIARTELDQQGAPLCTVRLTIEGSPRSGFHLIKDPDGFFTADDWFLTQREAMEAALQDFGVREGEWSAGVYESEGGTEA